MPSALFEEIVELTKISPVLSFNMISLLSNVSPIAAKSIVDINFGFTKSFVKKPEFKEVSWLTTLWEEYTLIV